MHQDEHTEQDEERESDKMQGLVTLLFSVELRQTPGVPRLIDHTGCVGMPALRAIGEAGLYIEQERSDRYDGVADTRYDIKDKQQIKFVWWMYSPGP
jgi:hypothetical protein